MKKHFILAAALALSLLAVADAQPAKPGQPTPQAGAAVGAINQKVLVVCYSRTGTTKKVCQALAAMLGADIEEVTDAKKRGGIFGYLGGGRDAMKKKTTTIGPAQHDPSSYRLVVLATPVWAYTVTPAIRTYIGQNKDKLATVAFLCTMGGSGDDKTFAEMESICGRKPVATVAFLKKDVDKDKIADRLKEFADKLR